MIKVGKKCSSCACKCLWLSNSCVLDSLIQYSPSHLTELPKYIDLAQYTYVRPYVKAECFDSICEAITKSNYTLDHADYVELDSDWVSMIDAAYLLILAGVKYLYESDYGCDNDCEKSTKSMEAHDKNLYRLKARLTEQENKFKSWVEDNGETYDCIEISKDECSEATRTIGWTTTKRYKKSFKPCDTCS